MELNKVIARFLLKDASKKENSFLNGWLSEKADNQTGLQKIEALWHAKTNEIKPAPQLFKQKLMFRLDSNVMRSAKRNTNLLLWRVAAILTFTLWIGTVAYLFIPSEQLEGGLSMIMTEKGRRTKAVLPDGTTVWLNSESKIVYNPYQWSQKRQIEIYGEVFFEVKHNTKLPFEVDAHGVNIRVLGTSFNVRSYAREKEIETTLVEGEIEIKVPALSTKTILHAGERFVYDKSENKTTLEHIDPLLSAGWKDGILAFKNASFEELTSRIAEYYQVNIVCDFDEFKSIHYSGTFENLMIAQVLEIVNMTLPITYKIENNQISIQRN